MPESTAIAPRAQSSFPCRAGLRVHSMTGQFAGNRATYLWIESPRTGKRISLSDGFFRQLPARVVARVACAVSRGRHVVDFTSDELRAINAVANPPAPQPSPAVEWVRRPRRRGSRSFGR